MTYDDKFTAHCIRQAFPHTATKIKYLILERRDLLCFSLFQLDVLNLDCKHHARLLRHQLKRKIQFDLHRMYT